MSFYRNQIVMQKRIEQMLQACGSDGMECSMIEYEIRSKLPVSSKAINKWLSVLEGAEKVEKFGSSVRWKS